MQRIATFPEISTTPAARRLVTRYGLSHNLAPHIAELVGLGTSDDIDVELHRVHQRRHHRLVRDLHDRGPDAVDTLLHRLADRHGIDRADVDRELEAVAGLPLRFGSGRRIRSWGARGA